MVDAFIHGMPRAVTVTSTWMNHAGDAFIHGMPRAVTVTSAWMNHAGDAFIHGMPRAQRRCLPFCRPLKPK